MNQDCDYLFVYGTLLRQSQTKMSTMLLSNSKFIELASVQGRLYDIGEYPGLIQSDKKSHQVKGEVFKLNNPDLTLQKLDDYEGCEYKRIKTSVTLDNDKKVESWLYIFSLPTDEYTCIESGDYMAYLGLAFT